MGLNDVNKLLVKTVDWIAEHKTAWKDYVRILDDKDKEQLILRGYDLEV